MTQIPPAPDDWWVPLARHLGEAYLEYAFTMGSAQEVEFIAETLGATAGERLLDVGCGPGRDVGRALDHLMEIRLDEGEIPEDEAFRRLDQWWAARQEGGSGGSGTEGGSAVEGGEGRES